MRFVAQGNVGDVEREKEGVRLASKGRSRKLRFFEGNLDFLKAICTKP